MFTGKTILPICLAFVLLLITVGISSADFQGTIGTRFTITGSELGIKKPRVYIEYEKRQGVFRKVYCRVESWSDTSIQCLWTEALEPGTYNLWVNHRGKGSAPISEGTFTIVAPLIDEVTPDPLKRGAIITMKGQFFTDNKPKVYLKDIVSLKKKRCRVLNSTMDPETGESSLNFVVPKWGSGNYEIILQTLVSKAIHVNSSTNPLDIWHSRNPLPKGHTLTGVAYGNGIFVTVGQVGTIIISSDGLEWQNSPSGVDNNLSAVAFGNDQFTVVGDRGVILTSSDGVNWTPRVSGTDNDLYDVTFGSGIFVVAGGDKILTSADGEYWMTISLSDGASPVKKIAYGNELFIAVGTYKTLISSTDGAHWNDLTIQQNAEQNPYLYLSSVVYANGIFYLVDHTSFLYGDSYSTTLSTDGVNWEHTNVACAEAAAYGNGTFVIVNDGCPSIPTGVPGSPSHSDILTSSDGKVWSSIAKPLPLEDGVFLKDITYGDGIFVAVGSDGVIFTSPQ